VNWQALPFDEIWTVDFEYYQPSGEHPEPICMVAKELRSGELLRLWADELQRPPFRLDDRALYIAYSASAELSCHLALGWPVPTRILDLYVEFRARTNGIEHEQSRSLLGALSAYGIPTITKEEKYYGRALAIRGGPYRPHEQRVLLDYCQADVDPLGDLLDRMLPAIQRHRQGLGQALLRGRYMAAVARMEATGVPIDTAMLARLREAWPRLKQGLVDSIDREFGVYEATTFKTKKFEAWLAKAGIEWPRFFSGQLMLDKDTFKDMTLVHPQLEPLRELRHSLSELRLENLAVGADGRNRVSLMPFSTITSRNAPSANASIFGPSRWLRHLIQPRPGHVLAYIDWSAQEVAIAAALSEDAAMIEAVQSGDPYLSFAKQAGLAPADATKRTHGRVRDLCKTCVLGSNYGMQAESLAARTGQTVIAAQSLLDSLARTFPGFWRWSYDQVDRGLLFGEMATVFGWPRKVLRKARPTALRNYPMQANAAEMLRIACCLATEAGVSVCAPIHDALLIEAPVDDINTSVVRTQKAMGDASRLVLGGLEVASDVLQIPWPDRYSDSRGVVMWQRINELLGAEAEAPGGLLVGV
jgi:DNA polymerase I